MKSADTPAAAQPDLRSHESEGPTRGRGPLARSKQARSQQTLQRLLEAADELIAEKGFSAVTINEIAHRAESSVGGFYARFRDKDELLAALYKERAECVRARIQEVLGASRVGEPLSELISRGLRALVAETHEKPRLAAALIAAAASDSGKWIEALQFRRDTTDRIAQLLLTRERELGLPDARQNVPFIVEMAYACVDHRLVRLEAGVERLSQAQFSEELVRMCLRYLGLAEPAPQP